MTRPNHDATREFPALPVREKAKGHACSQPAKAPAAMSHGIGSDSQRPFAIVIVGGLISDLLMSIFLLPTLYAWMAGPNDVLPAPEMELEEPV
jgi:hypothetical protein